MAKINTKIVKVETSVARPIDLQIFRGEKVPIELHFANYGQCLDITGYSVEAYYQSPDMGDSWYKDETAGHLVIDESGESVTWLWTPDIDAGADKYKWFVRVFKSGDEDDSYRAFGNIEMLASPAHNEIQPLPVPPIPIDCSKYEWLNAPWYTKEETDEAIADAISEIPAPDYPVTSVNGKTGAVVLSPSDVGAATAAQGAKADRAVLYREDVKTAVDIGTRNPEQSVGILSVAEGNNTTASGNYSHSEGMNSSATGISSHAEGGTTTASGPYSHAEGASTTAYGYYTHAEGNRTTAQGNHSHAEGEGSTAGAYASHAEGWYTRTGNQGEHAEGTYNATHYGNDDSKKTISSIGIGSFQNNKNAVEVMKDGKVFIKGVGNYDGTNPTGQPNAATDLATVINSKATQQYVDDTIDNLDASDVGAVPTGRTVNGKSLSQNVTLTASDVGALPDTYVAPVTSVNTKTGAVTLTAADVGAATVADATLTTRETAWQSTPSDVGGVSFSIVWFDLEGVTGWMPMGDGISGEPKGDQNSTHLEWTATTEWSGSETLVANRTIYPGFKLGNQDDKPLAGIADIPAIDNTLSVQGAAADAKATGDALGTKVPQTRTINNKALSANVTLTASDVGALADTVVSSTPANGIYLSNGKLGAAVNGPVTIDNDGMINLNSEFVSIATELQVPADWNASSGVAQILNKPEVIPVTVNAQQKLYKTTTDVQQFAVANSDQSKFAYLFAPQDSSTTAPASVTTNGKLIALQLQQYTGFGAPANPLTIPAGATANDAVARTSDLPPFETWTFELSDSTTVTKNVAIYN